MSHLAVTRGDSATFTLTLTDEDTGAPVNLTGMTMTFTAKRRPTDSDAQALIAKSTADGIVIDVAPETGLATLTLDPADTEDLSPAQIGRSLYWDLQIDDMAGDVRTPLSGLLAISADMTRASGAS